MKSPLLTGLLVVIAAITIASPLKAQGYLPSKILVGTDEVSAKSFSIWKTADPTSYSGTYSGDVGGDSSAYLKIKFYKKTDAQVPYIANGLYKTGAAGMAPTTLEFENAHYYGETIGVAEVGAFHIVFVTYKGAKGVVVNGAYIKRQ
jgi:hypothetical protein